MVRACIAGVYHCYVDNPTDRYTHVMERNTGSRDTPSRNICNPTTIQCLLSPGLPGKVPLVGSRDTSAVRVQHHQPGC